jgi:hypothetical protein
MGVRAKTTVVEIAAKHFKDFGLPLDIEYKSYQTIVGAKEALSPIQVKRSFKAWKYLIQAVKKYHPELTAPKPKPAPKPAPKAAPKPASKPAPKAAPKSKE